MSYTDEFIKKETPTVTLEEKNGNKELKVIDFRIFEEAHTTYCILYCEDKECKLYEVKVPMTDFGNWKTFTEYIETIL